MTGMGSDGAAGAQAVHAAHGRVFAQDEESSVVFGMAKEAIRAGVGGRGPAPRRPRAAAQGMGAMSERTAPRVLVVEDSRTQAAALCALLESHGYAGGPGRAAARPPWRWCRQQAFDVVISDVVMPGIDGFELCRRLKERSAPRVLPVMLLTGQTDPIDIVRGLQAGADNYATKPYDPAELLDRLRRTVADAGQRRPARRGRRPASRCRSGARRSSSPRTRKRSWTS